MLSVLSAPEVLSSCHLKTTNGWKNAPEVISEGLKFKKFGPLVHFSKWNPDLVSSSPQIPNINEYILPREFYGYQGAWIPLSWDEPSFADQTFAAHGKGGKERLVTIDRFSWTSPECWHHQSDWRSFNNYIYLPYWSQDKALLILLTRLRSVRKTFYGVLWASAEAGASNKTLYARELWFCKPSNYEREVLWSFQRSFVFNLTATNQDNTLPPFSQFKSCVVYSTVELELHSFLVTFDDITYIKFLHVTKTCLWWPDVLFPLHRTPWTSGPRD